MIKDPVSGEMFESCYEKDETYQQKFGEFSSSYEECRADAAGLYLQKYPAMYQVFGYNDSNVKDLMWVNVMAELQQAIHALQLSYNPENKLWKQAHSQAAWVIMRYMLDNQKQ